MYLDFETDGLHGSVYLACWINSAGQKKHSYVQTEGWKSLVDDFDGEIVAHNARYELECLLRESVITESDMLNMRIWCTMLGEWVLNGEEPLDLDSTLGRYKLGSKRSYAKMLLRRGVSVKDIPFLLDYCRRDVDVLPGIKSRQVELLTERNMMHIAEQRMLVCPVLVSLGTRPQLLDTERTLQMHHDTVARIAEIDAELAVYECNMNSSAQRASLIYDRLGFELPSVKGRPALTDTGQRSTKLDVLSQLTPETEEQRKFLDLYLERNKLNTLLTKNLNYFKLCNGVLRGDIVQARAVTHRLASEGRPVKHGRKTYSVQLQNIPRDLKGLFTAPDGWSVVEADYAQLEFVAAADLCDDEQAKYDIRHGDKAKGTDPHSNTARVLTENGQPTNRQEAKSSTFTPLFGGFGKTPAERAYVEYFKRRYGAITAAQDRWGREVVSNPRRELVTRYGMRFRFPNAGLSARGYITGMTQISNYPIQGFATGEMVPIALRLVWEKLVGCDWCYVSSTVHDSIILICRDDKIEELKELLRSCMLDGMINYLSSKYSYTLTTDLTIEVTVGTHWGKGVTTEYTRRSST